jgi:hypothetical protein
VQPVILEQLLADPMAQGQGLLARCLIAQPSTLAGSRLFRQVDPLLNPAVVRFNSRLSELLNQPQRTWDTGDGFELKPDDLHMTPDASAAWVQFYNQVEEAQAAEAELADARPFSSKAAEHAARIAGVVAVSEGHNRIQFSHIQGGIELASFYLNEHLRLTGAGRNNKRNSQLRTLYEWMRDSGPIVSYESVLQKSPRGVRNLKAQGIKLLLGELTKRGYIRDLAGGVWEVRDVQS